MKPFVHVTVAGHAGHGADVLHGARATRGLSVARGGTTSVLVEGPSARWVFDRAEGPRWLAGALHRADVLLLVVDAERGPQADTRDAVEMAAAMGVPHIVTLLVAPPGTDRDLIDIAELLVREVVDDAGFDGNALPILVGSADTPPRGLYDELDAVTPRARDPEAPLLAPVHWVFRRRGRLELVVNCFVDQGTIQRNATVHILGTRGHEAEPVAKARVLQAEMWHGEIDSAGAGSCVGLRLGAVEMPWSSPVPVVVTPRRATGTPRRPRVDACGLLVVAPALPLQHAFAMSLTLSPARRGGRWRPLLTGSMPVFVAGTAWMPGVVALIDRQRLFPGEAATVHVALRKQLPLLEGQRLAVRENGRIIGVAKVLAPLAEADAPTSRAWQRMKPSRRSALVGA